MRKRKTQRRLLTGNYLNALAIDLHWEDFCSRVSNAGLHALASVRFNQQDHAAATAGAANFAGQRAFFAGSFNNAVNQFCRYGGQISFAKEPLFSHERAPLVPLCGFQCHAQQLRAFGDFLHAVLYRELAINVRLKNFPVIDAMLPWLAGVAHYDAAFQLIQVQAQLHAMLSPRGQLDGRRAAKGWRIVVLRSRGHADNYRFRVAADMNPVFFTLARSSKAIQRGTNRHRHGAGAADAGASRGFGIGSESESSGRPKELHNFGEKWKAIAPSFCELRKRAETFFALGVARHQLDLFTAWSVGFDYAG